MEKLFLNEDIKRLIFSFGYPKHRKYMKEIIFHFRKEKYKVKKQIEYLELDYMLYNDIYYEYPDNFIYDVLNRDLQIKLLKQFMKCYCCNRHIQNRPYYKGNILYYSHNNLFYEDETCDCKCRYYSRLLYNSIQYNNPSPINSKCYLCQTLL